MYCNLCSITLFSKNLSIYPSLWGCDSHTRVFCRIVRERDREIGLVVIYIFEIRVYQGLVVKVWWSYKNFEIRVDPRCNKYHWYNKSNVFGDHYTLVTSL